MYVLVLRVRVSCISDTFGLGVDSPRVPTFLSLKHALLVDKIGLTVPKHRTRRLEVPYRGSEGSIPGRLIPVKGSIFFCFKVRLPRATYHAVKTVPTLDPSR
jgi:hypothetical protein